MCGIAGLWSDRGGEDTSTIARVMATRLAHRGPDDQGCWADRETGIALAHRRLSIVDLSPWGHQPMLSPAGRYVIVFNGEIFNHDQLRRELLEDARFGGAFRGHSDTEVMLAAIDAWGLLAAVQRFVGMFAFALWDTRERHLYLVRDRLGIKPLYYGWVGRSLVFGSELKALSAHPEFSAEISRPAVAMLMRRNCIPAPESIYEGIRKVLPGTIVAFESARVREPTHVEFWSARDVAARGMADPFDGSTDEAVNELERLLREAVGLRMVADVPLGAFLSGGVDSSTVVALMQSQSNKPVKTFSIGSHDEDYDEAPHARAVAHHLGTDHTELYVSAHDALGVIPQLPTIYDEPFSDSSQIPTYLISKLARQHVTVALSGDGGDELFGGYNRHVWLQNIWTSVGWIAPEIRRAGGRTLATLSPETWSRLVHRLERVLPKQLLHRSPGYKLHKLAGILGAPTPESMYERLLSHWGDAEHLVLSSAEPSTTATHCAEPWAAACLTERMLYGDLVSYLPDDILTKVDRASMAVGLEARVPLLDHRVVEFAWRVPLAMKIRNGQGKWLLRRVLDRYVPASLIERPKSGFGIPLGSWLRGPLRGWAEDLLNRRRLVEEGFFDPDPIREKWSEHLSGRRNWEFHLWDVLMFQAWYDASRTRTPATCPDLQCYSGAAQWGP